MILTLPDQQIPGTSYTPTITTNQSLHYVHDYELAHKEVTTDAAPSVKLFLFCHGCGQGVKLELPL